MKVRLSYDEGETWTEGKVINPGSSAYSSLTVLGDRTIGLLYEAEGYKEIRFARFSLDWLTDGADTLHIPVNINEITSNNNIEIYPNPAKEFITIIINFDMEKDIAIEIIDLMGKPVIKREIYRTRTELIIIPTDSLSHGAYTVLIKTDAKIYSEKVLIIN